MFYKAFFLFTAVFVIGLGNTLKAESNIIPQTPSTSNTPPQPSENGVEYCTITIKSEGGGTLISYTGKITNDNGSLNPTFFELSSHFQSYSGTYSTIICDYF